MKKRKIKFSNVLIILLLSVVASLFVIPVLIVVMNSFKSNISIGQSVFAFPNSLSFVGFANYTKGFTFGAYSFWLAFFYSVYITISSVFLI